MRGEPIIEFQHVTMPFKVQTRHYGFKSMLIHPFQTLREQLSPVNFNALNDISLSIGRGERIGLVGPNGSGKTTLLSIVGGVYRRYRGEMHVNGRVAMMLALGAGFNRQLSGRDNIIMNGVLQGKTCAEMEALMEDIVSFADIGRFLDAPLFQYSSGMLARIGFAVATAIRPDILLVDEVMAVGDADFKRRCEGRIRGLLDEGTTLILVSHSPNDIRKYCNRVIALENGRLVSDGSVEDVL